MIRNLIELGILPVLPRDVKKIKDSLKMHEHLAPIKLDSGNIAQDFIICKVLLGQLGMKTEVNQDAMRAHVAKKEHATLIDLRNLSEQDQIAQAQALAQIGLNAKLTVPVVPQTPLNIQAENPIHVKEIFENALNQGFKPDIVNRIHQKMEVPLGVKVEGNDPKILFERVQHCMTYGYMPVLLQEQKAILQNYAKNQSASLTVSGFHGQAVIRNLTLAMELGFSVSTTVEANQVNKAFLQECNAKNKPEKVSIHPIMQQKTRFFFFKRTEVNLEETAKNAQELQNAGFCVDLTALHSLREEAATKKGKTRFFSNKLTDAAQRWERFYTGMLTVDATDAVRVKDIEARKPKQNTVMPVVSDSADKRPAAKLSAPYITPQSGLPRHPSEPNTSPSAGLQDTVKKPGETESKPDRDKNKV
ncbi:MAG: hypothetical protein AB7V32_05555 [Candidatus Berkiella sp.]